jgi:hypothetical protein
MCQSFRTLFSAAEELVEDHPKWDEVEERFISVDEVFSALLKRSMNSWTIPASQCHE